MDCSTYKAWNSKLTCSMPDLATERLIPGAEPPSRLKQAQSRRRASRSVGRNVYMHRTCIHFLVSAWRQDGICLAYWVQATVQTFTGAHKTTSMQHAGQLGSREASDQDAGIVGTQTRSELRVSFLCVSAAGYPQGLRRCTA